MDILESFEGISVGDTLVVRRDLAEAHAERRFAVGLDPSMKRLAGETVTVAELDAFSSADGPAIYIAEDNGFYVWTANMFEAVYRTEIDTSSCDLDELFG